MNKLCRARRDKGFSRAVLAGMVGIKVPSLYHLERTKGAEPRARLAQALAKALGTTVETLWPVKENR